MGLEFLIGGALRMLPELTNFFGKSKELSHEAKMLELQIKADTLRASFEYQKMEKQGEFDQAKAEIEAIARVSALQLTQSAKTGSKVIDFFMGVADVLSKMVRPVLTYWYCIVGYGAYKTATYYMLLSQGLSWDAAILQIWTAQDYSVMFTIISFWFVDRAIKHTKGV